VITAGVHAVRVPRVSTAGRTGVVAAAHPLLRLQRAAGNAAVGRLVELQRAPDGMLARGSSGEQVRAVQVDLNALGATPQLEPDAKFGGGTDTAVRVFQRAHRLKPDGIVGPATSTMIRNERAIKGANFLVPCHTPEKPGPDGPEAKALDEEVDRRGGNLLGEPGAAKVNLTVILTSDPQDQAEAEAGRPLLRPQRRSDLPRHARRDVLVGAEVRPARQGQVQAHAGLRATGT